MREQAIAGFSHFALTALISRQRWRNFVFVLICMGVRKKSARHVYAHCVAHIQDAFSCYAPSAYAMCHPLMLSTHIYVFIVIIMLSCGLFIHSVSNFQYLNHIYVYLRGTFIIVRGPQKRKY